MAIEAKHFIWVIHSNSELINSSWNHRSLLESRRKRLTAILNEVIDV